MSLYCPPDRLELHTALGSQLLLRHSDTLSERKVANDEACNMIQCKFAGARVEAGRAKGKENASIFIDDEDIALSDSSNPIIQKMLEGYGGIADIVNFERRKLRDALVLGTVTSIAFDSEGMPFLPDYWRTEMADATMETGIAEIPIDGGYWHIRILIDRDSFENWLNEAGGAQDVREEVRCIDRIGGARKRIVEWLAGEMRASPDHRAITKHNMIEYSNRNGYPLPDNLKDVRVIRVWEDAWDKAGKPPQWKKGGSSRKQDQTRFRNLLSKSPG